MAAGNWIVTTNARTRWAKGSWNMDSATMKCGLVTSSSNISASSTTWAALTNEVSNANGYTTGGVTVDFSYSGTTTVAVSFASNPQWTATGSGITFRTAVLFEASGDVLAFSVGNTAGGGTDVSVPSGYNLVINSSGTPNPAFTLTGADS